MRAAHFNSGGASSTATFTCPIFVIVTITSLPWRSSLRRYFDSIISDSLGIGDSLEGCCVGGNGCDCIGLHRQAEGECEERGFTLEALLADRRQRMHQLGGAQEIH